MLVLQDGYVGLIVGLTVSAVLLLLVAAAVGILIYRGCNLNPADPHVAEHLQHEYQKTITAESGEDVTLTCRAPNKKIIVIVWSREDLKDEYVLFYQKAQFVPEYQHPYFKNRVDLQDRQMKDGDVSLILKDVNTADSGTYECRLVSGTKRRRRDISTEPISIIYLCVVPPAQKIITAVPGQDVTLTCRAPNNDNNNNIRSAHWSRAGLGDKYVLLYQGGQFVPDHQHPSFKNRVDLQDRQMKDGDVSLILRNVSIADIGTYECRVYVTERHSWEIISNTTLTVVVCPDRKIIPAESVQKSVTLTCRAPNNNITSVHWSRADLEDKYVLMYHDGQFDPKYQHPSFKNRVDLQDRQMKDGDVSLILKDVTINDAGTYECRVLMEETDSWKSISITYLRVGTSCPSGGHPAWIVLLVVLVIILVLLIAWCIYIKNN
ncbi:immunoglobulin superfamily member 1-like [Simochromis diagramma]|uniref:immunoglobulin superfamily member 1-like n=1 Tax=Simochromis diagramma TaxID=43689 RepID=UPI001A7E726F|nr:immunoglobulin superfamily member 1-like [Simochromis diagramma]